MSSRAVRSALRLGFAAMRAQWMLIVGLVLAMAVLASMWVGVPLYAEAASSRILADRIDDTSSDVVPLGYVFSFNRLTAGTRAWNDVIGLNEFTETPSAAFGSSINTTRRIFETAPIDIGPDRLSVVAYNAIQDSGLELTAGRLPAPASSVGAIEVLLHESTSARLGLGVGEVLTIADDDELNGRDVLVAGTWRVDANQRSAADRFLRSGSARSGMLVSEESLVGALGADTEVINNAQWMVLLDPDDVRPSTVPPLLDAGSTLSRQVDDLLRGTRVVVTPETLLEQYPQQVARLNRGLRSFSIPTLVLLVAVVALLVEMQRRGRLRPLTMLRRRGIPAAPLVASAAIEAAILSLCSIALAIPGARMIARLMGRTETFLRLAADSDLSFSLSGRVISALVQVFVVCCVLQLVPYLSLARSSRGQRRARVATRKGPAWQRGNADLVIVAGIVLFSWFVVRSDAITGDLLDDPVVILMPAAIALAAGLLLLRVLPGVLRRLANGLDRTNSTSALLAFRKGSVATAETAAPLVLLVLTAALAIYTASLARTMDLQLLDRAHHLVGGESSIAEPGDVPSFSGFGFGFPPTAPGPAVDPTALERIYGTESASRVAELNGGVQLRGGGTLVPVQLTAVDPVSFSGSAFWRDDYATRSLSSLMATLEASRDGILLRRSAMINAGLVVGDVVSVRATNGGTGIDVDMVVVGHFDHFPSWQPSEGSSPAVVSLPDLEQRTGDTIASRVLFRPSDTLRDDGQTRADFARIGILSSQVSRASDVVMRAQVRPERQGIFGLLTVGFGLSAMLTVAGFVFYALAGYRSQVTQLGILRATGLSHGQIVRFVVFDLLVVAVAGVGVAVAVGAAMSQGLLPRLVGTPAGSAPPLLPAVDWMVSGWIAGALVIAFIVVSGLLAVAIRHIRPFEAIKIGGQL